MSQVVLGIPGRRAADGEQVGAVATWKTDTISRIVDLHSFPPPSFRMLRSDRPALPVPQFAYEQLIAEVIGLVEGGTLRPGDECRPCDA